MAGMKHTRRPRAEAQGELSRALRTLADTRDLLIAIEDNETGKQEPTAFAMFARCAIIDAATTIESVLHDQGVLKSKDGGEGWFAQNLPKAAVSHG